MRRGPLAVAALVAALAASASAAASAPPPVSAPAYVVESAVDGATLAARDADRPRAVASITKLMTVLVALEHARLDEVVVVPRAATRIGEATIFLRAGDRVTVRDLALGALVPSANDAAAALALHVGRGSASRFVSLMNATARLLGMRDTRFANPHGLDQPGHVSTASDVVRLLRAALAQPFIRAWAARREATLSDGRRVVSTDSLLARLPQLVAGKTGHTSRAGWSQVAAASDRGVTIYAAVLGASSEEGRDADLEGLLRWGLRQYRRAVVVDPSRTYALVRTGWGKPDVRLVAARRIVLPAPVGRPLVERVVATAVARLPVARGQRLGEVRVFDGTRVVARSPLVADRAAAEPGLLGKAGFVARRSVHHLVDLVT